MLLENEETLKPPIFNMSLLKLPDLNNIEDLKEHCLDKKNIKDEVWKPINISGFRNIQISNFGRIYSDKDERLFSPYLYEGTELRGFDKVFYAMNYIATYNDSSFNSTISVPISDLLRMTFGGKDRQIHIRLKPKDGNIFNAIFDNLENDEMDLTGLKKENREFYFKGISLKDFKQYYKLKPIYINNVKTRYSLDNCGYIYKDGKHNFKGEIRFEDKIILRDIQGQVYRRRRYELMGKAFLPNAREKAVVKIVNKKITRKVLPHMSSLAYSNIKSRGRKIDPIIFFH